MIRKLVLKSQQAQDKKVVGVCSYWSIKSMCNIVGHIILFLHSVNLGEASS